MENYILLVWVKYDQIDMNGFLPFKDTIYLRRQNKHLAQLLGHQWLVFEA